MKEFLLILKTEGDIWTLLPPDKLQQHLEHGTAYINRLAQQGKIKHAQPLERGGRSITKADGIVKDAPYNETKEVIAGYFIIEAEDIKEAVALAGENPIFNDIPTIIEVHPIKPIPSTA